jgi:uncharacterized protein (DUF1330 family)
MTAYVIVETKITDPIRYEEYKRLAAPTVEMYGGRYIARGGRLEVLEGSWSPPRLVILEFPSLERAKDWLNSPVYGEAKKIRHKTAVSNMVVVEGI